MANDTAAGDPMMTTEMTTETTFPSPATPTTPAFLKPPSASPERIVDHGDPDIPNETRTETTGVGTEGEVTVWEDRYSMRNFLGRFLFWGLIAALWFSLATYTWGYGHEDYSLISGITGIIVGCAWLVLLRRIILARFGHFYELTNRRIFVSTGVLNRRRDQMELLRVQDVYTQQSFLQRLLSVGTIVVVSSEPACPILYLYGVDDPKFVMDLVWHHARAERDRRSVKVDQI